MYEKICSWDNLLRAYRRAAKGKRGQPNVAAFEYRLEDNLLEVQAELHAQIYQPGEYHSFYIHEPKRRLISAAPFRDRVVHHALCNLIEPVFERGFSASSYANRRGKGTHRALNLAQTLARRYPFVLQCDVRQFFPSIDHAVLRAALARKITDERVLWLCGRILDSGRGVLAEEYTQVFFAGDDLLASLRPRGLPIGNLTSQFWANVYLNSFDHFVQRELGCGAYVRYVDDVRRRETAQEETQRRDNVREKCCKAPTLSRPGNRLGSVAWWERPEFCNPQQTTEGQARLDMARAKLPKDQFRAVIA